MIDKNARRVMGIAWFVIGLALLVADVPGGLVFLILGLVWMAGTFKPGVSWAGRHPNASRAMLLAFSRLPCWQQSASSSSDSGRGVA